LKITKFIFWQLRIFLNFNFEDHFLNFSNINRLQSDETLMNLNRQMISSVEGENAFIHHPKAVKSCELRELKRRK
jgi:hypothetical protein